MARPVVADPRRVAVTNTSPVIGLVAVGQLCLLDELFELIVVPMKVWDGLNDLPDAPEPKALMALRSIAIEPPRHPVPPEAADLDPGEVQAIAAAVGRGAGTILLDEKRARKIAAGLGLHVVGTLGVLVQAKRRGFVTELRPLMQQLQDSGAWLSTKLINAVLVRMGEPPIP